MSRPIEPLRNALPVEEELVAERASALRRTGEQLEQAVLHWKDTQEALLTAPQAERGARRAARDEAMRELSRRLWNLIVHREAIGQRNHDDLYTVYGIPQLVLPSPR